MYRMPPQRTIALGMLVLATMLTLNRSALAQEDLVPSCAESSLYGPYAYSRVGMVVGIGPAAANGVVTFDGQGNLAGTDTASRNGQITARDFKGTYTVTPDCTGTATFVFSARETVNVALQIGAGAREVQFIQTDSGTVITGSAKAQWARPGQLDIADAGRALAMDVEPTPDPAAGCNLCRTVYRINLRLCKLNNPNDQAAQEDCRNVVSQQFGVCEAAFCMGLN